MIDALGSPGSLLLVGGTSDIAVATARRYLADTGEYPPSVGLSVWGTSAMRTSGDDVAEVLALIGCRPRWDDASRRVVGVDGQVVEVQADLADGLARTWAWAFQEVNAGSVGG